MAQTFQIGAEYLHTLIGRRVAVPAGGGIGRIPIVVAAVRHHPESGIILVDANIPVGQIVGLALGPGTIVDVEFE